MLTRMHLATTTVGGWGSLPTKGMNGEIFEAFTPVPERYTVGMDGYTGLLGPPALCTNAYFSLGPSKAAKRGPWETSRASIGRGLWATPPQSLPMKCCQHCALKGGGEEKPCRGPLEQFGTMGSHEHAAGT